jgi:uncharacterized protein (TIRG00374 family)
VIATALTAVVVVAAFAGVLPRVADLHGVWPLIRGLPAERIAALTALTIVNLFTFAALTVASLPGLRFGAAFVVTQVSTAVANTVPAGGGVGVGVTYALLSGYGFPPSPIAVSVTTTGVANLFVKFAMPAVAAALLAVSGDAPGWVWHAARIGAVLTLLTAAFVRSVLAERGGVARRLVRAVARGVARVRRRDPVAAARTADATVAGARRDAAALFRPRGAVILGLATVSHLALYVLFVACLAAVHVRLPLSVSFAVFAVVRLGLAVPVTPGSVGVAEAGYAAALVSAGATAEPAVAAVLLFRAASYLVPIPVGLGCWLAFSRSRPSGRATPAAS